MHVMLQVLLLSYSRTRKGAVCSTVQIRSLSADRPQAPTWLAPEPSSSFLCASFESVLVMISMNSGYSTSPAVTSQSFSSTV